ncbi:MAG: hypothetical protein A3J72_08550 [Nitrospirae bacterium RIFCSPHIGHO2_02_FULL_40_19]|nr:MAG: hypothetical protein A3J72_08550 [Nitrospirae bacterium RIFCSPHIGHO2_02_FULL_40_19]
MKVAAYYSNRDVQVKEMPIPEIGVNEFLLETRASGICGSDTMKGHREEKIEALRKQGKFWTPGHEISGIVVEVGENVFGRFGYSKGKRVFVTHHVNCGNCRPCRKGNPTQCREFKDINNFVPGGMAEYVKVGGRSVETGVIRLNDEMSYDQASFIEPLGTVVEMLKAKKQAYSKDDTVLVLGSGIVGILQIQYARARGVEKIFATDISEFRLKKARELGADYAFHADEYSPEKLRELNQGRLADWVIDCVGSDSVAEQAFKSFEPGGKIIGFAIPQKNSNPNIDRYKYCRDGYLYWPTYGASPEACQEAYELIRDGKINVNAMITHNLPLEDIAEGFRLASEGKECLKVIINPHMKKAA